MLKILLIEDKPAEADLVREMLHLNDLTDFDVIHTSRLATGLERLSRDDIDAVLLDLHLPDSQGLATFQRTVAQAPEIPIVVLSSLDDQALAVEAVRQGAQDYLVKGRVDEKRLARAIRHAVERKQIEEALRQKTAMLVARNKDLDMFADTVAHDLKNPLSLMFGFTGYLQEHVDTLSRQEIRSLLGKIIYSCCKMENIIEALLVLSSVRRLDVEMKPLDMEAIVEEALGRLAPMIEKEAAQITMPDSWPVGEGYAPWVEEVWVNYLSNALKYGGDPPQITLGGQPLADGRVKFWVQDQGAGIPLADQANLFTPLAGDVDEPEEGHGLGLSIVRRIVDRLGGEVGVESQPGHGSTFYFTLPAHDDQDRERR